MGQQGLPRIPRRPQATPTQVHVLPKPHQAGNWLQGNSTRRKQRLHRAHSLLTHAPFTPSYDEHIVDVDQNQHPHQTNLLH